MSRNTNTIDVTRTDDSINRILLSGTDRPVSGGAHTCHFNQNEDQFIILVSPLEVPRISVHHAIDNREPPQGYVEMIANLAANALRSSQGDAKVRLVASSNSLRARLEVQDNGPAIPESFRPRVFEKYATRAGDRGRDRRAVGLGLTFCRLAIEAHGGAIGFESGEDGTTFWIELPGAR